MLQIRSSARTFAEDLGRCVDRHEDHVGGTDSADNVRRKEQIAAAGPLDDRIEAWLIDRERAAVPGIDPIAVDVGNGHRQMRAAIRHDSHGRAAHVAGTDTHDVRNSSHRSFERVTATRANAVPRKSRPHLRSCEPKSSGPLTKWRCLCDRRTFPSDQVRFTGIPVFLRTAAPSC
jgi:hypothetical protein